MLGPATIPMLRSPICVLALLVLAGTVVPQETQPQEPQPQETQHAPRAPDTDRPIPARLRAAAFASTAAGDFLVELCDRFGGRLTGGTAHRAAVAHVAATLEGFGLSVHSEPCPMQSSWRRAPLRVDITAPDARWLPAESSAWTPALASTLVGRLVVDPAPGADVAGAAVLIDARRFPLRPAAKHPFPDAALVLVDGARPLALVPTGLATWAEPFVVAPVPAAFIAAPDAAWLRRRAAAGAELVVTATGGGVVGEAEDAPDLIAELPGAGDLADQIVLALVGLDSWDVGRGAVADAAGVATVVEAARLLAELDRRPRRTIRFALVGGTAQGLGSAGYAARLDEDAAAAHVAALVFEGGGGWLSGLHLDGSQRHLELAEHWFEPVRDLGVTDIGFRESRSEMPRALQALGVPAFAFVQVAAELDMVIGTRADTPERVDPRDLAQAACVLATGLWAIADAPAAPPRFER